MAGNAKKRGQIRQPRDCIRKLPKNPYLVNLNEEREITIAKPITIGKQKIVTIEL